jgi:peptidoglycan/xylan/chitin deacetylase (PgdA/CDA1 family)
MSAAPVVSVSVDLDALWCYYRIHALPGGPPEAHRHVVLRRCLPRFADLFAQHGVKATFFVVGADLEQDAEGRALLAALARDGHELANHSYRHPYELTRLDGARVDEEIDRAHALIADCAGTPPVGFRSPGYETSREVIDRLCARGYLYDSSAFPSVPYYLAKAAVMGVQRLRGRASGSILGRPTVLRAPRAPYHPSAGDPYRSGGQPIVELPMAVTPWLRLPVIGTSIVLAPDWLRRRLTAAALGTPFFNFELHGIDLADAVEDAIPEAVVAKQPDLRVPLGRKRVALDATLRECRAVGARFQTLREVAAAHAGRPS